jgi:hypothetical protein
MPSSRVEPIKTLHIIVLELFYKFPSSRAHQALRVSTSNGSIILPYHLTCTAHPATEFRLSIGLRWIWNIGKEYLGARVLLRMAASMNDTRSKEATLVCAECFIIAHGVHGIRTKAQLQPSFQFATHVNYLSMIVSNDPSWWSTIDWNRSLSYFTGSWGVSVMSDAGDDIWCGIAVAASTMAVYDLGEQGTLSVTRVNYWCLWYSPVLTFTQEVCWRITGSAIISLGMCLRVDLIWVSPSRLPPE